MDRVRLAAWGTELRRMHEGLRRRLDQIRPDVGGAADLLAEDVQSHCVGLCSWITEHHTTEDARLFPMVLDAYPELAPVIARLQEDHDLISSMVVELERALTTAPPEALGYHLDGIAAILDSHFAFEERTLGAVLDGMTDRDADFGLIIGRIPRSPDGPGSGGALG